MQALSDVIKGETVEDFGFTAKDIGDYVGYAWEMYELDDAMEEKNESLADHKKRFERTVSALERVMTHLPTMASWPPGTSGEKSYGMVMRWLGNSPRQS